jgi:hypothetical protein
MIRLRHDFGSGIFHEIRRSEKARQGNQAGGVAAFAGNEDGGGVARSWLRNLVETGC